MKNLTVVLCDALRSDHVNPATAPNLTTIAAQNITYRSCRTGGSATNHSMPWMLSGEPTYIPQKSIIARLKRKGYKTILLSANPLVDRLFSQGWDTHESLNPGKVIDDQFNRRKLLRRALPGFITYGVLNPLYRSLMDPDSYLVYQRAEQVLDRALKLRESLTEPYFMWIHLMDPHHPYYPLSLLKTHDPRDLITLNDKLIDAMHDRYKPTTVEALAISRLYMEEVKYMDKHIGRFYSHIDTSREALAITADHGDEFGEHGGWGHHEDKMVPELTTVPLIVANGEQAAIDRDFHHKALPDLLEYLAADGRLTKEEPQ